MRVGKYQFDYIADENGYSSGYAEMMDDYFALHGIPFLRDSSMSMQYPGPVPWIDQCWVCRKRGGKNNLCPKIISYLDDFNHNKPYHECEEFDRDEEFESEFESIP